MHPLITLFLGFLLGVGVCDTACAILRDVLNRAKIRRQQRERFERQINERITDLTHWVRSNLRDNYKVVTDRLDAIEKRIEPPTE